MRKCNRIPRYSLGEMATKPAALTHIDTSKLPDWVGPKNSIDFNNIASKIGGYAGAANNVIGSITDSIAGAKMGQKPSVAGTLGKMGSLAATGMSVGGPWGAAAGAAAGLILGTMGSKGKVDKTTGDVTEPSGWLGMGVNKHDLYKEGTRIQNSNLAEQIGQQYALQAAQNDDQNDFTMAAYGDDGIDTSLAYLDDGELIRTPDGSIQGIPEQGKPTDSNLINVPVGTQVLSDKLKVPGTKYTFAQMGKKLMKPVKVKGEDRYAQNSAKLNEMNNQQKYDQLLELQETMKLSKPKKYSCGSKGINAYKNGTSNTTISDEGNWQKTVLPFLVQQLKKLKKGQIGNLINDWNNPQKAHAALTKKYGNTLASDKAVKDYQIAWNAFGGNTPIWAARRANKIGTVQNPNSGDNAQNNGVDSLWGNWTHYLRHRGMGQNELNMLTPYLNELGLEGYLDNDHVMLRYARSNTPVYDNGLRAITPKANLAPGKIGVSKTPVGNNNRGPLELQKQIDWPTVGTNLATLGMQLNDIANMEPEITRFARWTPQYGPTDYNIEPQLAQAALTDSINRYNIQQVNPNTGANMAMQLASGVNRDNTIANLYAQKFNAENQMKLNNAGIYNQWAPDNANRIDKEVDANARNRAQYLTALQQARANVGSTIQQMNRDRIQRRYDDMKMLALSKYMNAAMPSTDFKQIYNMANFNVQ